MAEDSQTPTPFKTTAAQWDAIRLKVAVSDFSDTSLNTLAQNLGLDGWPLKSAIESPAKYVEMSLKELSAADGFNTRPRLVDQLYFILRGTLEHLDDFVPPPRPAAKPSLASKPKSIEGVTVTSRQWDNVRKAFSNSLMVDMKLSSLAENLEMDGWMIDGDDETPAKYLEFTLEELAVMGEFRGKAGRIDRLFKILNDNLAQQEEFEEMIAPATQAGDGSDVLLQVLRRYGIPADYPIEFIVLPKSVRDTTPTDQVKTLGQFVQFYQRISEKGVVLGDVKTMLQAISAGDEERIATWMPFRPGEKGFHLIEAIALNIRGMDQDVLKSLVKKYGKKLEPQDDYMLKSTWQNLAAQGEAAIQRRLQEQSAWFESDISEVKSIIANGASMELDRYLLPLGDADLELIVAHALIQSRRESDAPSPTTATATAKTPGLFGRIKAALFGNR